MILVLIYYTLFLDYIYIWSDISNHYIFSVGITRSKVFIKIDTFVAAALCWMVMRCLMWINLNIFIARMNSDLHYFFHPKTRNVFYNKFIIYICVSISIYIHFSYIWWCELLRAVHLKSLLFYNHRFYCSICVSTNKSERVCVYIKSKKFKL